MDTNAVYAELEQDIKPYASLLNQAADAILDQDVSSYPIFVFSQDIIDMGLPIVEQKEGVHKWGINASTLEELVTKNIIATNRVDNFREVYKNPKEFLCLFVLNNLGATFVFLPRTQSSK